MVAQQVSHTSEGESRTRYYRQMYNDHEQIIYQFDIINSCPPKLLNNVKFLQKCIVVDKRKILLSAVIQTTLADQTGTFLVATWEGESVEECIKGSEGRNHSYSALHQAHLRPAIWEQIPKH